MKSKANHKRRKRYTKKSNHKRRKTYTKTTHKIIGGYAQYIPIEYIGHISRQTNNPTLQMLCEEAYRFGLHVWYDLGNGSKMYDTSAHDQKDTIYFSLTPDKDAYSKDHVHLFNITNDTVGYEFKRGSIHVPGKVVRGVPINSPDNRRMFLAHINVGLKGPSPAQTSIPVPYEKLDDLITYCGIPQVVVDYCRQWINEHCHLYLVMPNSLIFSLFQDPTYSNYFYMYNINGNPLTVTLQHIYQHTSILKHNNVQMSKETSKGILDTMKQQLSNKL